MGKGWGAALLAAALAPAAALAQAEDEAEEPCGTAICGEGEAEVSGGPLDLSHLGRVRQDPVPPEEPMESGRYWGIREHQLYAVPAGTPQPPVHDGTLPARPKAAWPGEHQLRDWDFAKAWSYPELTRSVDAESFTFAGSNGHGDPVFGERVRANLYLLQAGVTFFNAVANRRDTGTDMDLDLRVPFVLGDHHQLAVLPGVSFPIDSRDWSPDNTSGRVQVIYGFGAGGLGIQARVGVEQGHRRAGFLRIRDRLDGTASLAGALVAWRFAPAVQLRAEASAAFATDAGDDVLTLLPGVSFFPLGDPRVTVGASAIVETFGERVDFEDAAYGAMVHVGAGFI
ncbi:MAG TPA: hypothetical protein VN033_03435 [Vulgatibacter sp.]|nr:hypothetical protein [Vulgatibacter sp.]